MNFPFYLSDRNYVPCTVQVREEANKRRYWKMNKILCILLAVSVCIVMIVPAMAQPAPSTPFLIWGWVTDSEGAPLDNPDVLITNLDTLEEFTAETYADSNYYQVMISSENVSAGNELNFSVNSGTPTNHEVTQAEINAGGFEQNLTAEQTGLCGDVTENDVVDTGDVILLANYVGYPGYTIDERTGDVTGNGVVDTGDVILLANYVGYPGYELNCK